MTESDETTSVRMETATFQLGIFDWVVIVLMLVGSVTIGVFSAIRDYRRASTREYLLGGRSMPPLAVGLSLVGGWVSAISILGSPTEVYFYGTQITTTLLGVILAAIIMHQITIPILYNLNIYSICEYLELRYRSVMLRKVGTIIYLLNLCVFMAMCLYAPSLAVATITGISTVNSIIIMGVIVTFYITIGGVKAVVYTDVLQTLVMFGGVLAVVVLCCFDLGGVKEVWAIAERGGRLEFFNFDTNPFVRHTFWSTVCFGLFLGLNLVALDQSVYQRFASVSNVRIAKGLAWFFLVGLWCLWIVFFFSGLVSYATYSTCDPLTSGKINKPDQIIPYLVTDKLGHIPALSGIFVAAVYGGMLSSLSSSSNSVACMVWQDLLKPQPYFRSLNESTSMLVVKSLSALTGVVVIGLGVLIGNLGNIFLVIFSLNSAIIGPLSGLFLAGMLLPWVNAKSAFLGLLVSFSLSVWLVMGKFAKGGGTPPQLPLSVEGCPPSFNSTLDVFTTLATTSVASTNITHEQVEDAKDMYDISYCYTGMIAFLISVIVSGVVALVTGPTRPEDLREGVVNPTCMRLYLRLCRRWWCARRESCSVESVATSQEAEVVKLEPPSDTNPHSSR